MVTSILPKVLRPVAPLRPASIYKNARVEVRTDMIGHTPCKVLDAVRTRRVKRRQERKVSQTMVTVAGTEEPVEHILYVWEWFGRKRRKA